MTALRWLRDERLGVLLVLALLATVLTASCELWKDAPPCLAGTSPGTACLWSGLAWDCRVGCVTPDAPLGVRGTIDEAGRFRPEGGEP